MLMSAVPDWDRRGSLRLFHRDELWNMENALVRTGWTDGGDRGPAVHGDAARGRGARAPARRRKRSASGQQDA
jgi:hypothetical protein